MALQGGDVEGGTGLANEVFAALEEEFGPFDDTARKDLVPFVNKFSGAIVDYFVANAEVTVVVRAPDGLGDPGDESLQTSTSVGNPTGAPAGDRSLGGSLA